MLFCYYGLYFLKYDLSDLQMCQMWKTFSNEESLFGENGLRGQSYKPFP